MKRYFPLWLRGHTAGELLDSHLAKARVDLLEVSAQREYYAAMEQLLQNRILRLVKLKNQGDIR